MTKYVYSSVKCFILLINYRFNMSNDLHVAFHLTVGKEKQRPFGGVPHVLALLTLKTGPILGLCELPVEL